ncbi:hypothetical protein BRADI_2g55892v3 [Brachypodium distachyon]|uniref:glutathione transferase n=1 Tax=Brachypodium distachyon TaxID=15368 RepID=A0A0Q3GI08_BRADI|nr:hypothetical protein BRADI_2g55892v3 [Brachypodium distachyon]
MDHGGEYAPDEKVELLGTWSSPYVFKVIWALTMKGVEYEYVEEDLRNKSGALLSLNPLHKKVPVLVYRGKPVAESDVIVEFIDEAWKDRGGGGRILPEDPYERAMARSWVIFARDVLSPPIWKWFTAPGEEEQEGAREAAVAQLLVLEEELGRKEFFAGDCVGLVDLSLGALAYVIPIYEEITGTRIVTEERLPCLSAWMGRFLSSPPAKDHLPPLEKLKLSFLGERTL